MNTEKLHENFLTSLEQLYAGKYNLRYVQTKLHLMQSN